MYASPMFNSRLISIEKIVSQKNPAETEEDFESRVKKIINRIVEGENIEPIEVRQEGNFYIVGDGHHRFEAIKRLGWKVVPCVGLFEY